jgi:hypothetical protein
MVKSDLMLRTMVRELSAGEKKLLKYEAPETGLVIYNTEAMITGLPGR